MADEIDLLNVSFDGQSAPDRVSAKAGVKELKKIAPLRRYISFFKIDYGLCFRLQYRKRYFYLLV